MRQVEPVLPGSWMVEPSMTRIRNSFPKMAAGCFSIHCPMTPTAIQRNHSPEVLRRFSKATSEMEAIFPCFALTTVSLKEHPSARWINKIRSKVSALSNLRHRRKAPSSFALVCHPVGKKPVSTCQSSSWSTHFRFFIVTPMGDNYIKTPPHKSIIKLALMPPRGEGGVRGTPNYLRLDIKRTN